MQAGLTRQPHGARGGHAGDGAILRAQAVTGSRCSNKARDPSDLVGQQHRHLY